MERGVASVTRRAGRSRRSPIQLAVVTLALGARVVLAGESAYTIRASSFLGGSGDEDSVVGVRIQRDGCIVLAADLSADIDYPGKSDRSAGKAEHGGAILRLSADGQQVVILNRVASEVKDLALDGTDNIYVAAGRAGAIKLSPRADRILWTKALGDSCDRIDAAADGHCVALCGGKRVVIMSGEGKQLTAVAGKAFTTDVCIDSASRTVVFIGFRNARAHDGRRVQPVQIAYVKAVGYDGQEQWTDYDWSTDRTSDRFLNRSGNNMADTRAYRSGFGRDGKLYVAFESAGGNHMFRYLPTSITEKAPVVGGGPYHEFWGGGGAAHRTVFGRFDVRTGSVHLLQQVTGRTERNHCTNVRMKQGAIASDEEGRVFLAGWAQARLPIDLDPVPGQPLGGPFLLGMTPDLRGRLVTTRMHGRGSVHGLDVRTIGGRVTVAYGGSGAEEGMFVHKTLQRTAKGKDAFFVILHGAPSAPPSNMKKKAER